MLALSIRIRMLALAAILAGLPLAGHALAPIAQAQSECQIEEPFASLRAIIEQAEHEDIVGDCLMPAQAEVEDGDVFQLTDSGLLVQRESDGQLFFTDGHATWTLGPAGLDVTLNAEQYPWEFDETIGFVPSASYLFVAQAAGGTLQPDPGTPERHTLTLVDVDPTVVYFSDRPHRLAGDRSIENFVQTWEAMGFVESPPNAAIVLNGASAEADVLIVMLEDPTYDPETGTLTFQATVLPTTDREGLAIYTQRADPALPAAFGFVSLFIDSVPAGTIIAGCRLEPGAQCPKVNLNRQDLSATQLSRSYFREGIFELTNFQNADLRGAVLSKSNLRGANLRNADLTGARFVGADLTNADLRGAKLDRADLREAKLNNADLRGAILSNAQANRAIFTDANMSEPVNFSGADLTGANLRSSRAGGLILGSAIICNTTMPDGTISNRGCPPANR